MHLVKDKTSLGRCFAFLYMQNTAGHFLSSASLFSTALLSILGSNGAALYNFSPRCQDNLLFTVSCKIKTENTPFELPTKINACKQDSSNMASEVVLAGAGRRFSALCDITKGTFPFQKVEQAN